MTLIIVVDIFKDPKDPVFKDMDEYAAQEERRILHEETQSTLPEEERTP